MPRFKKLFGMFLAALPDICAGVAVAHVWLHFQFYADTFWQAGPVYAAGVVCALLPDVSLIAYGVIFRRPLDSHHRDLTHYPLPILGVLGALGFFTPWAWFAALCIAAHFLDDTTDPGGIAWLWPFTRKKFQVFAREKGPLALEVWLNQYFFRFSYKLVLVAMTVLATGAILYLY